MVLSLCCGQKKNKEEDLQKSTDQNMVPPINAELGCWASIIPGTANTHQNHTCLPDYLSSFPMSVHRRIRSLRVDN